MTFTAVVTSHGFERGLRHMLGNLMYQTRRPDETIVCHSGYAGNILYGMFKDFPWVARWIPRINHEDAGHDKRAYGLGIARSDFIGWFNDDDKYDRTYVEKMMVAVADAPVAYCNWNKFENCDFRMGSSTSGNFIVSTDLARDVGYQHRDYCADGHFIDAIAAKAGVVKVEELLYYHNEIPRDT